jgi:hypothetical protein
MNALTERLLLQIRLEVTRAHQNSSDCRTAGHGVPMAADRLSPAAPRRAPQLPAAWSDRSR